jgi:hypothetical protein
MRFISLNLALVSTLLIVILAQVATADTRAQELVKQARAALGGEDALNAIRSLSLVGKLRREDRSGEINISFMLPDKFKKSETTSMIADIELTFTSAVNGDQVWTDSSTTGGGGNARVNSRQVRSADNPQAQAARGQQIRSEFARQLISLLLLSPPSFPLEFSYAGEAESKTIRADMLDVKGPGGFHARLFLDKTTHRPLMMKYRGLIPRMSVNTSAAQAGSREDIDKILKDAKEGRGQMRGGGRQEGDIELYFSEYRAVNGVLLPHRITKSFNGKLGEEWGIKRYRINPSLTAQDFEKK